MHNRKPSCRYKSRLYAGVKRPANVTYDLPFSHNTSTTNIQTDGRQQTTSSKEPDL